MPKYKITKTRLKDLKKSYDFYCKDKKITIDDLKKVLKDFNMDFSD